MLLAEQLRDGYLTPVRNQAEKFQVPPNLPLEDKHRFFTVLSGAYIFSGEPEKAVQAIEKSLQEDPDNLRVRENAANIYLMADDLERANSHACWVIEKTRSTAAFVVFVQTTFARGGRAEVDALLSNNAWALTDQAVQVAIAVTYLKEDNLEDAEAWLRRDIPAEIRTLSEIQHLQFLAEVLIERAQAHLAATLPLARPQDATSLALLTEALEHCQTLIDYLEPRDLVEKYARALALRGTAQLLSGNSAEALDDLDKANALGDKSDLVQLSKARCLLDLDRIDEVVRLIEKVPADTRSKGYDGLLASAHYRKKQYQRAVASFKSELPKTDSKGERLAILGGLLDCYVKLNESEAAEDIYETLSKEAADDQPALASIASYLYHKGETDRAHALFQDLTQSNSQGVVCLEYADLLARENRWPEVADLLLPFVDKDAPIWLRERYAVAAFNANQFARVLDLLEEWETSPEDSRTLTELELELRLRAFDFTRVVSLAKVLLELEPDYHRHKLTLIQAQVGLGDYDVARTAIEQLDPVALKEEPATLVWLAHLAQALKIPKALEFAWEAVRAAPDDHVTFADYFSICISDTTLQEEDVAALDTTVTMRLASGEEITRTLLTRRDLKEGELNVESPKGKALLGKRVGDNVSWGHGLSGVQYADVIKVRSKYVKVHNYT